MTEDLQRLNRNREEREICELWDKVRDLEQEVRDLASELEQFKSEHVVEAWKIRRASTHDARSSF